MMATRDLAEDIARFIRKADDIANDALRKIGIRLGRTTDAEERRAAQALRQASNLVTDFGDQADRLTLELSDKVIPILREAAQEVIRVQDAFTDVIAQAVPVDARVIKVVDDVVDFPVKAYTQLWILTFDEVLKANQARRERLRRKGRIKNGKSNKRLTR